MATINDGDLKDQDFFDRMMRSLTMRGDVLKTEPILRRSSTMLGTTETYTIQTFRHELETEAGNKRGLVRQGDTILIEHTSARGLARYVLVPVVSQVIAEQRGRLDNKVRRRAAAKAVETKKANQKKAVAS